MPSVETTTAPTLSSGEQQMLSIARALTLAPRLPVLDEPAEGLAPVIVEEIAASENPARPGASAAARPTPRLDPVIGATGPLIRRFRG